MLGKLNKFSNPFYQIYLTTNLIGFKSVRHWFWYLFLIRSCSNTFYISIEFKLAFVVLHCIVICLNNFLLCVFRQFYRKGICTPGILAQLWSSVDTRMLFIYIFPKASETLIVWYRWDLLCWIRSYLCGLLNRDLFV